MPDDVFPPYTTATHGLYAMYLDHVPDWEEPRQAAMLAWLQRGGRLHLLLDSNRQQLRFSGMLAPLNEPFPEFAVGAGTVVRQDIQRTELTNEMVNAVAAGKRKKETDELTPAGKPQLYDLSRLSNDEELFQNLAKQVEPKHSWFLIACFCLCYIGLLYPGAWWFSQKKGNRHIYSIAYVLGTVLVFSGLFIYLGQRGYGETTSFRSLMIAIPEDATHWSCLQFGQVFVTEGADCRIEDSARQTLMASGLTEEAVDATISSGNNASFSSRLPPFSCEPLVARSQMVLPDWEVRLDDFTVNGTELSSLTLRVGPRFPFDEKLAAWIVYRDRIWPAVVDRESGSIRLTVGSRWIMDFLSTGMEMGGFLPLAVSDDQTEEARSRQLDRQLIRRGMSSCRQFYVGDVETPADRIQLLVRTEMPASCNLTLVPTMQQTGQILYLKEVPLTLEQ